jgi:hypothetical protein
VRSPTSVLTRSRDSRRADPDAGRRGHHSRGDGRSTLPGRVELPEGPPLPSLSREQLSLRLNL